MSFFTNTYIGKVIATFFVSMLPIIELRAGLPFGIGLGLDYSTALIAAIVGNMLPVPFIILLIRKIFAYMKKISPRIEKFIVPLENKADSKSDIVCKYGTIGLYLLVAIPLPGTGAWTGSLVAAMLNLRLKRAVPAIFFGVLTAAMIMTAITYGAMILI